MILQIKRSLLLVLGFIMSLTIFSQSNSSVSYADYSSAEGAEKMELGIKLIEQIHESDMEQAIEIAKELYAISKHLEDEQAIVKGNVAIGKLYAANNEPELALSFFNKAQVYYKKSNKLKELIELQETMALVLANRGHYVNAIKKLHQSDSLAKAVESLSSYRVVIQKNLGLAFSEVGLYDLSNDYFRKGLELDSSKEQQLEFNYYLLMNSLLQNRLFSANNYFNKIEKHSTNTFENSLYHKAIIGLYFAQSDRFVEARATFAEIDSSQSIIEKSQGKLSILLLLAKGHFILKDNVQTNKYATQAIVLAKKSKNLLQQKKSLNLALLASTKMNAANSHELASSLDSVDNEITKETGLDILKIVRLEQAFGKMAHIEKKVSRLTLEKESETSGKSKAQKIGIMLTFAIVMLAAMLIMAIRQMKSRQKELEEHKRKLQEKSEKQKQVHIQKIKERDQLLDIVYTRARDIVVLFKVETNGLLRVYSINESLSIINQKHGLNLKKEVLIGKSLQEIFDQFPFFDNASLDEKLETVKQVIQENKSATYNSNGNINGIEFEMEVTIEPVRYKDNEKVQYVLYTLKDITKKVKLEREHLKALIETEEKERERIAQELHDGLGQNLTAAQIALDGYLNNLSEIPKEIQQTRDFIQSSLQESRAIAHNIIPKSIKDFGLVKSLQQLIDSLDDLHDKKIEFNTNIEADIFTEDESLHFYRIAQEAINNAIKHSKCMAITIQLNALDGSINLTIEDDGKGFNLKSRNNKKGFGLQSIINRAKILGAKSHFDSKPNGGTLISIELNKTEN